MKSIELTNAALGTVIVLLQIAVIVVQYKINGIRQEWMKTTNRRLDYLERLGKELREYRGY